MNKWWTRQRNELKRLVRVNIGSTSKEKKREKRKKRPQSAKWNRIQDTHKKLFSRSNEHKPHTQSNIFYAMNFNWLPFNSMIYTFQQYNKKTWLEAFVFWLLHQFNIIDGLHSQRFIFVLFKIRWIFWIKIDGFVFNRMEIIFPLQFNTRITDNSIGCDVMRSEVIKCKWIATKEEY